MQILLLALKYWKPLAVIALCAGLYGAGWYRGHSGAVAACQEKALRAEIAVLKRNVAVQRQADAVEAELNKAAADAANLRELELQTYVDELRASPGCRRNLDAGDIGRLRKIDGGHRP